MKLSPSWSEHQCVGALALVPIFDAGAAAPTLEAGLATRDITPEQPIFLAGYAVRRKPSESVDAPLKVQSLALRSTGGEPFVFVALDNCEVSRAFMEPVNARFANEHGLKRGAVMVVSSHTHSAPICGEYARNHGDHAGERSGGDPAVQRPIA